MTALDWLLDLNLCGRTFAAASFAAFRAFVAAVFGLPMTEEMLAIYRECTGRQLAPLAAFARGVLIGGRGVGKTLGGVFLMLYVGASRDYRKILGPGELATVAFVTPDRKQSRVAMRYLKGLIAQSPMLAKLVESETSDSVTLTTGCVLEVHTANFKSVRGYSLAGVVVDEAAFLPTDDAANPDIELIRAVTPGLARVPGSLLLCMSSPYSRRGFIWEAFRKYHGVDGAPCLVWQAPTRRMNPTIPQAVIDEAMADDPAAARSEWGAQFREDLEGLIGMTELERCCEPDRIRRPPQEHIIYAGATDAASGTTAGDSWTAVAYHQEHADAGRIAVIDDVIEIRPPFQPSEAAERLAAFFRPYGVGSVVSDKYASQFLVEALRRVHLAWRASEFNRSEAYLAALPWLVGGRVSLPDPNASPTAQRLIHQFANLQRRTTASTGRDLVDHPRGGHDDLSNVVALAIAHLGKHDPSAPRTSRIKWG